MAMKEIITKKLYKNKYPTMEQYFKEVFKLSRASVYRFVDASRVLTVFYLFLLIQLIIIINYYYYYY